MPSPGHLHRQRGYFRLVQRVPLSIWLHRRWRRSERVTFSQFALSSVQLTPTFGDSCVQATGLSCVDHPCVHGTCVDAAGQTPAFTCTCNSGYSGTLCDRLTDACAANPCQNGGQCIAQGTGYTCNCPREWTGPTCTQPVEECGGRLRAPSGVIVFPTNGGGSVAMSGRDFPITRDFVTNRCLRTRPRLRLGHRRLLKQSSEHHVPALPFRTRLWIHLLRLRANQRRRQRSGPEAGAFVWHGNSGADRDQPQPSVHLVPQRRQRRRRRLPTVLERN